jgi:hypothetical protein
LSAKEKFSELELLVESSAKLYFSEKKLGKASSIKPEI